MTELTNTKHLHKGFTFTCNVLMFIHYHNKQILSVNKYLPIYLKHLDFLQGAAFHHVFRRNDTFDEIMSQISGTKGYSEFVFYSIHTKTT